MSQMVLFVWHPLVLFTLVVQLFCISIVIPLTNSKVTLMVVLSWPISNFMKLLFCVVCLYASNCNPERDDFFSFCESSIDPSVATLLRGDFNTVFDQSLDRCGSNIFYTARESLVFCPLCLMNVV